MVIRILVKMH